MKKKVKTSIIDSKSTTEFPKSDLRSYWKKATNSEKAEMNDRGFQELRDTQEMTVSEALRDSQYKLMRVRAQTRDRQQRHHDRSRERKISEGWLPGQKRVSPLTVLSLSQLFIGFVYWLLTETHNEFRG